MVDSDVRIGVGATGVSVTLSADVLRSLAERLTQRALYGGPCLIIDRDTGLALDSTTEPRNRTRPVLWTPHALPWQQWRISRTGRGAYRIASEHGGRVLTTDSQAHDRSPVWLEHDRDRPEQRWRLVPTEDSLGFIIETLRSEYSLDTTGVPVIPAAHEGRSVEAPTSPIMWSTHAAAWQQWMVLRLPLR